MRDTSFRHWHRWRITANPEPAARPPASQWAERLLMPAASACPEIATDPRAEQPGPDGIRHELVARIRREIAAGTYDTEERWQAAEAELLRRIEERM